MQIKHGYLWGHAPFYANKVCGHWEEIQAFYANEEPQKSPEFTPKTHPGPSEFLKSFPKPIWDAQNPSNLEQNPPRTPQNLSNFPQNAPGTAQNPPKTPQDPSKITRLLPAAISPPLHPAHIRRALIIRTP